MHGGWCIYIMSAWFVWILSNAITCMRTLNKAKVSHSLFLSFFPRLLCPIFFHSFIWVHSHIYPAANAQSGSSKVNSTHSCRRFDATPCRYFSFIMWLQFLKWSLFSFQVDQQCWTNRNRYTFNSKQQQQQLKISLHNMRLNQNERERERWAETRKNSNDNNIQ